ncbi:MULTISPECIES: autotransporter domain-containing protein [unclassified Thalassospira]|uniref:autotransporter domain-containing protein n=1 Tax=unclassified Thalassospira TaxID=2648997 RepID=UPI000A1E2F04|nr:autotransporter domain-containing protein [Thalassospira sp. MCCC 1A01428]
MKLRWSIIAIGTACIGVSTLPPDRVIPPWITHAHAAQDKYLRTSESPILRTETMTRSKNRLGHLDRLSDRLDGNFVTNTLQPLFLDGSIAPQDQPADALAMGTDVASQIESYSGRDALGSLAERIDFDSANGSFPTQDRATERAISIWVHGTRQSIDNRVTRDGFNPGLNGDVIAVDTGVDYRIDTSTIVGIALGWGSTASDIAARQTLYRENNVTFSPYFLTRMTDWLKLNGSLGIGSSDITRTGLSSSYENTSSSMTYSGSVGFDAEQNLGQTPLSLRLSGNLISARESYGKHFTPNGEIVSGHVATSTLFDSEAEARYRIEMGDHTLTPFMGENQTMSVLNEGFGQDQTRRYFSGTDYNYSPLSLNASLEAFREFSPDDEPYEGVKGELRFSTVLPRDYGTLQPFVNTERDSDAVKVGGGIDHYWTEFSGHVGLEINQTVTFDQTDKDPLSGLLTLSFNM